MRLSEILGNFSSHDAAIEAMKSLAQSNPKTAAMCLKQIKKLHENLDNAKYNDKDGFDWVFTKDKLIEITIKGGTPETRAIDGKSKTKYLTASAKSEKAFSDALTAVKALVPQKPVISATDLVRQSSDVRKRKPIKAEQPVAEPAPAALTSAPAPASNEAPEDVQDEATPQPSCLSRHKGKLITSTLLTTAAVIGYFKQDAVKEMYNNLPTMEALKSKGAEMLASLPTMEALRTRGFEVLTNLQNNLPDMSRLRNMLPSDLESVKTAAQSGLQTIFQPAIDHPYISIPAFVAIVGAGVIAARQVRSVATPAATPVAVK